jgi:hypothetical protein
MEEESPECATSLCAGKVRTWNVQPGPLANGKATININYSIRIKNHVKALSCKEKIFPKLCGLAPLREKQLYNY